MYIIYKWNNADFDWNAESVVGYKNYTWDEATLITQASDGITDESWNQWDKEKKKKLIKLILKVHGDTITESKKREIKQYKIKARDIRIVVKEVLGTKMIAENVSI